MVIKRRMNSGFAGIDNPLYYFDKTLMLFGDAKGFVGDIVRELTGGRMVPGGKNGSRDPFHLIRNFHTVVWVDCY